LRITIGRKLAFGFTLVLVIFLVSGLFSNLVSRRVTAETREVVETELIAARELSQLYEAFTRMRLEFDIAVTYGRLSQEDIQHINDAFDEGAAAIERLLALRLPGATLERIYAHIDDLDLVYRRCMDGIGTARTNPGNVAEIQRAKRDIDNLLAEQIFVTLHGFRDDAVSRAEAHAASVSNLSARNTFVTLLFLVIGALIGIVAAFVISRGISRAARELSRAAERMSLGDLDVTVAVDTKDEMADLADSFERMKESLRAAVERLRKRT
jgi:HAMP domain-containing protein